MVLTAGSRSSSSGDTEQGIMVWQLQILDLAMSKYPVFTANDKGNCYGAKFPRHVTYCGGRRSRTTDDPRLAESHFEGSVF